MWADEARAWRYGVGSLHWTMLFEAFRHEAASWSVERLCGVLQAPHPDAIIMAARARVFASIQSSGDECLKGMLAEGAKGRFSDDGRALPVVVVPQDELELVGDSSPRRVPVLCSEDLSGPSQVAAGPRVTFLQRPTQFEPCTACVVEALGTYIETASSARIDPGCHEMR